MNPAERRLLELLEKIEHGTATPAEKFELDEWYASFEHDPKLTPQLPKAKLAATRDRMLSNIRKAAKAPADEMSNQKRFSKGRMAITLLVLIPLLLILTTKRIATIIHSQPDAMPGSQTAVLTLGTGKRIDVGSAKVGVVYTGNGYQIIKNSKGMISYRLNAANSVITERNVLSTPAGGQFLVVLADGSKVWLNAMSSLTYPAGLSKHKREVNLNGEGYFEVAKDRAHPFEVTTLKDKVEVLGTHFNIAAYTDEATQKTTLLEGSVKVSALAAGADTKIIKPGEQAEDKGGLLNVKPVNAEDAASWKDGVFSFDHTELRPLMQQLARWYNVDVVYQGQVQHRFFSGEIDRSYTLRQVLKVLELGDVHFRIENPSDGKERKRLVLIP
ncbi:FecR domain-containing protein [Mucilaginibacter sp. RS28]|uniref:FecR domain-containing protein n=1 Tax=Mucilaginibacter straminoryzae TaxID=2932774 RepID=A0A9X2B905_9SPHI|nr:FecR domain-containing protein [Mucilaginibacter straminoryzae]MCJ8209220.1 FecR domain-containing protein [Mucilaginibacter straminoryzae]